MGPRRARTGYANGFKPKTLTKDIPQVSSIVSQRIN